MRIENLRDISESERTIAALEESEFRWKFAMEGSGDGVWDWSVGTEEVRYSNRWKEILGFGDGDDLPTHDDWVRQAHPADQSQVAAAMQDCLDGKTERYVVEYRARCKDASFRWVLVRGMVVLRNESGEPLRMIGTLADIDERKHNEEKLSLAACVFASAGEGILITSADGKIVDVNSSFTRITGYSRDEVIGKDPRLLSSSRHQTEFFAAMWRDLNETGFWRGEIWNRRKNGQVYTEIQTITAVRDAQDKVQYYVALYSDISQLKERESDLEQIAHYDALTGLPNRVLLADRLRQAMASTQRRERQLGVAFLDLDGFKFINDQYGHEIGDLMLIAISNRMKQALRDGDTIARLGGDEFVALLPDLVDVASCLPMLSRIVSDVAQPVTLGEHVLQISVSLGVTFFPQKTTLEADDLLRQADHAMYKAKIAGKNRYHLFGAD
jgi:diguanylate cyclase (GGDEF)-like protein/PAS domain S-box-containing protein